MSGIPGLAELPLLKYVFGSKSHEVIDDEIVFVLIPHVVRGSDISPLNLRRIDTGSGQTIQLRHITESEAKAELGASAAAQQRAAANQQPRPANGMAPLKGQTAEAASNSALAQMRQQTQSDVPQVDAAPASPSAAVSSSNPVSFVLNAPNPGPAVGTTFKVPVVLSGGKDISSVPLQIQYDASKLTLVNVDSGDLLGKDGQAVALVHRDDGPGMITIAASRPPGTPGVSGSGSVCVLSFQAKAPGDSDIVVTHPGALDSAQHIIPASAQNAHVVVH